jgi:hypothetical protein
VKTTRESYYSRIILRISPYYLIAMATSFAICIFCRMETNLKFLLTSAATVPPSKKNTCGYFEEKSGKYQQIPSLEMHPKAPCRLQDIPIDLDV